MKKLITTILLLVLFSITPKVLANNFVGPDGQGTSYLPTDDGLKVTIVSDINAGKSSSMQFNGHAYLIIENLTSLVQYVCNYKINGYQTITIGTYQNSLHDGIWINREIETIDHKDMVVKALTKILMIKEINDFFNIIEVNNYWSATLNCSSFATKVWNEIDYRKLNPSNGIYDNSTALYEFMEQFKAKNYITLPPKVGLSYYYKNNNLVKVYMED